MHRVHAIYTGYTKIYTVYTVVAICICQKYVTNVSKHCSMCKSDGAMPFSLSCQKVIYDCIKSPLNKTYMNYEFSLTLINLKITDYVSRVQLPPRIIYESGSAKTLY